MSDVNDSAMLASVTKRDGREEPFDADKICQSLFAATEALGTPNAFLARELTDAVVHFLAADLTAAAPATSDIAAHVAKVVRELGQPDLARQYALVQEPAVAAPAHSVTFSPDDAPADLVRRCLRAYSERVVFSRDLVSAQGDGLILLAGLDTPQALVGAVMDWPAVTMRSPWADPMVATVGQGIVIDGPEWFAIAPSDLARLLDGGACRSFVVNLNSAQAPAGAARRSGGPLFGDEAVAEPELDGWVEAMTARPAVSWHWHVQTRDFTSTDQRRRLREVARRALDGVAISFVCDRPRRSIVLAEGIDRAHPAALMEVALDLAAFLRRHDVGGDGDAFRQKLPSLARMAVSAGAQKRKYLRRHAGETQRGFLLDRARLAVVPLGLNAVVRTLVGQQPAQSALALDAARAIVRLLHDALNAAGQAVHLNVGLDSPGPGLRALLTDAALLDAGLSCADVAAPADRQLAAAGALHAITAQGTCVVLRPDDARPTADDVVDLLHTAWRRTETVRVVFRRMSSASPNHPS